MGQPILRVGGLLPLFARNEGLGKLTGTDFVSVVLDFFPELRAGRFRPYDSADDPPDYPHHGMGKDEEDEDNDGHDDDDDDLNDDDVDHFHPDGESPPAEVDENCETPQSAPTTQASDANYPSSSAAYMFQTPTKVLNADYAKKPPARRYETGVQYIVGGSGSRSSSVHQLSGRHQHRQHQHSHTHPPHQYHHHHHHRHHRSSDTRGDDPGSSSQTIHASQEVEQRVKAESAEGSGDDTEIPPTVIAQNEDVGTIFAYDAANLDSFAADNNEDSLGSTVHQQAQGSNIVTAIQENTPEIKEEEDMPEIKGENNNSDKILTSL